MRDERLSGHKRSVTCIQVLYMAGAIGGPRLFL